jgi:hypothetical protein
VSGGDALLQIAAPVDEGTSQILSQIEATGWNLSTQHVEKRGGMRGSVVRY